MELDCALCIYTILGIITRNQTYYLTELKVFLDKDHANEVNFCVHIHISRSFSTRNKTYHLVEFKLL